MCVGSGVWGPFCSWLWLLCSALVGFHTPMAAHLCFVFSDNPPVWVGFGCLWGVCCEGGCVNSL